MLSITIADFKNDIAQKMKGTSIRQIGDFYEAAFSAANRMLARIDTEETRRTTTLSTPFYDNVLDYNLPTDYKRMIDIRPQANRIDTPGDANFQQTTARQFNERLTPDSFSIRWNDMIRTLRAQVLPAGNCVTMDTFDSPTANGSWGASVDASGLYTEPLNYVAGNGSTGFNLSGVTGVGTLTNSTASVLDLYQYRNEDASTLFMWIPIGFSSRITSVVMSRGDSSGAYRTVTITTKSDGTAFTDGWNFLLVNWNQGVDTGSPTNLDNTYRVLTVNYSIGAAINGMLFDSWLNNFGVLYEMEYYSEYCFRTAAGVWISKPTDDTDLVNISPASYEILKTEMMVDVTQIIRTGPTRINELADWRFMLNGQSESRYVRTPQYSGLYADYTSKFPSSAIVTATNTYQFDC